MGNIGDEYADTRHNIGFKVLDALAEASNVIFRSDRLAYVAEIKVKGRTLILVKPTTYMNLSGKAVNYWAQKEKIPVEKTLIICDDLAIPFGSVRIRKKGGAGGHNGLKDIIEILKTEDFARMRVGVGSDFAKGQQVNYVLGQWSDEEKTIMPDILKHCCGAIKSLPMLGIDRTMNTYNKK